MATNPHKARLQFIDLTLTSSEDRRSNRRLIHSHVGRLNRQKAIERQHSAHRTNPALISLASKATSKQSSAENISQHVSEEVLERRTEQNEIERPISPAVGALLRRGFEDGVTSPALERARYFFQVIAPSTCTPTSEFAEWFQAFCEHPVVYHGYSSAVIQHRALTRNHISAVDNHQMLTYRNTAIRLINDKLSNLKDEDVEPVILGICTISLDDQLIPGLLPSGISLFVPHVPTTDCTNMYGRNIQAHHSALVELTNRMGGIDELKLVTLARTVGL